MTRNSLAIGLLLFSGLGSAESLDVEPGRWQLLSIPGQATASVGSLFADELTSDTINDDWAVFTLDSDTGDYEQLEADDIIDTSDAFWLIHYTDQTITIDLELVASPADLLSSEACASSNGCVEHELNATGVVSWALVGSPFTQSVAVNDLRLITISGTCSQGCTMAEAKEEELTDGIFYRYDASSRRYDPVGEGDFLRPESGYWFGVEIPRETEGASLLIPSPAAEPETTDANLLFRSGFESGTTLTDVVYDYQRLEGTDEDSGYEWNETLDGLWGSSNNGIHLIDGGGVEGAIRNELQSVIGHSDENTSMALYQSIDFSSGSPRAQTPYQINRITDDPDEYYISYWIKIDDTSMTEPGKWRIIWQFKSDRFNDRHPEDGYRISVYIYTDDEGIFWNVKGDDGGGSENEYWEIQDRDTPVPRDEWFKVEVYSKVSAGEDGRFWAKINGTEIASRDGPNLGSEEDTMYFMMLWQLYGDSYPSHQWIDDVEIWDGVPY
ncbi:MAG: heparin lyase I family protein [Granulosicoccus sp.]